MASETLHKTWRASDLPFKAGIRAGLGTGVLLLLLALSRCSDLLFHSLVELAGVALVWAVFMVVWNLRRRVAQDATVLLGVALLHVGVLDLAHVLAYEGMGVFPWVAGPDPAAQLRFAARCLESVSLLAFSLCLDRPLKTWGLMAGYAIATALILAAVLVWPVFPAGYADGRGMAAFRIIGESLIILVLIGAAVVLGRRRDRLDPDVYRFMQAAIVVAILAEMATAVRVGAYDLSNLLGHCLKLVSLYFIYEALIRAGLTRPYEALFRDFKRSENLHARILETAMDGFCLVNLKGRIIEANAVGARMLGYTREEMARLHLGDIEVQAPPAEAGPSIQKSIAGGRRRFETRLRRRDGTSVDVEASCRQLAGNFGLMLISVRDITQRRRDEVRLKESEARYRSILQMLPDNLFRIDTAARITDLKSGSPALFPLPAKRIVGKTLAELLPPRIAELIREKCRATLAGARLQTCRFSLGASDDQREFEARMVPYGGDEVLAIVRDVTDQKVLEERLVQLAEHEQKRLAMELHDGLCQDLKSLEFEAVLLEDYLTDLKPAVAAHAATLGRQANRAVRAVYAIMRGLLPVGLDDSGFAGAIYTLASEMEEQSRIGIQRRIQASLEVSRDFEAYQLYRIAQEALGNAVRHARPTWIRVYWGEEDGQAVLCIEDNGSGFVARQTAPEVNGMGMTVMRSRAQAIGAFFDLHSRPGQGTCVRVRLTQRKLSGSCPGPREMAVPKDDSQERNLA
jgi:PAS domain S-box-containing protein